MEYTGTKGFSSGKPVFQAIPGGLQKTGRIPAKKAGLRAL
jgi:hypothetical protein